MKPKHKPIPSHWAALPDYMRTALVERLDALDIVGGSSFTQGWATRNKRRQLAQLVIDHECKTIVEIGVFGGRSLIALALAGQLNPSGVRVVGYDPYTVDAALEEMKDPESIAWWQGKTGMDIKAIHAGAVKAVKDCGVEHIARIIAKTDADGIHDWADGSLDLLHLDGNHEDDISLRTAELWLPKLRAGGILVQDDVNWPQVRKTIRWLDSQALMRLEWLPEKDGAQWGVWQVPISV